MTALSEEDKYYLKYQIYSLRYDDPWITNKKVAKLVDRSISTVERYARQAEVQKQIINPQPKLKPHPSIKAAFLSFENKYRAFEELQKYPEIRYLCLYHGEWDIMMIYDAPVKVADLPGYKSTVVDGVIGPSFTPKVRYTSWEKCFELMENYLEQYQKIESTYYCAPRSPAWDEEEWKLYYYFATDLRNPFSAVRKKTLISWRKYEKWKQTLWDNCTMTVGYFPEGAHSYYDMTLCFRTRYEKYLVELFSFMPTTANFYRIGDHLLANIFIPKEYGKQPKIYSAISRLQERGIISDYKDGHGFSAYWDFTHPSVTK